MDSPVVGFSHVQLLVGDIARSADWYAATLGLQRLAGSPEVGYLAMAGAGGRFAIVLSPRPQGDPGGAPTGIDHLAFTVKQLDELRAWAAELTNAGLAHSGLVSSGEGTSIHLTDPDGLPIELITSQKLPAAEPAETAAAVS